MSRRLHRLHERHLDDVFDDEPDLQLAAADSDGMGFFGYKKHLNANVEVISYDRLVKAAMEPLTAPRRKATSGIPGR